MRVLELFAGCGGAAAGLHAAGWTTVAAFDREPAAVASLSALGVPAELADLSDVSGQAAAAKHARVDLTWASPPCQPWSAAQTRRPRGTDDEARNGWPWTLRILDGVRPRSFVAENVARMATHPYAEVVLRELRRRFPVVEAGILDAAYFGAGQSRRRWIVYAGPRDGFSMLIPRQRQPAQTLGEVLPWLRTADPFPPGMATSEIRYTAAATDGQAGSRPDLLDRPAPTVTTTEEKGTRANRANRWRYNGGPDRASDAAFVACGRRRLTVAECALLQGLDAARLRGTVHDQYRMVGNAVHPAVARAIGATVRELLRGVR